MDSSYLELYKTINKLVRLVSLAQRKKKKSIQVCIYKQETADLKQLIGFDIFWVLYFINTWVGTLYITVDIAVVKKPQTSLGYCGVIA